MTGAARIGSSTGSELSEPRPAIYRGWPVLIVAAMAMVGTLPGRTQGLGLITEPLIRDLGIDRVSYAHINFWATVIGASAAIGVGRLVDRFGSRVILAVIALALGVVVSVMSQVGSLPALATWLTLTRGLGQSALSVVSIAIVGHWFVRRIDMAMAVYTVLLSVGFMIAFPTVGWAVQQWGWRTAWFAIGLGLVIALAPAAWLIVRRSPESCGLAPDGVGRPGAMELPGQTLREAAATPAFWLFALGGALYGLVASGIGLFNESVLAERGFGPGVYYQSLVVTAMTALAGNFLGGWLAGRVALGRLLAAALVVLAAGLAALPLLTTFPHVMVWATSMGLGGGLVTVLFFSVWPRLFGRLHLGRIQGAAQALTVVFSAAGPVLLAWCVATTGSYRSVFILLSIVTALVALCAMVVRIPTHASQSA